MYVRMKESAIETHIHMDYFMNYVNFLILKLSFNIGDTFLSIYGLTRFDVSQ